jgi:hypothetical protein
MSGRAVLAAILAAGLLGGVAGAAGTFLLIDQEPHDTRTDAVVRARGPQPQDWMMRLAFREAKAVNDAVPRTVGVACPHKRSKTCSAVISGGFSCTRCTPPGQASRVELIIGLSSRRVVEWRRVRS